MGNSLRSRTVEPALTAIGFRHARLALTIAVAVTLFFTADAAAAVDIGADPTNVGDVSSGP
ncbi:hypothetical protein ACFQFH_06365 [Halobaculum halobium]|uniref:Uncharacterized protein n=1 Tax=Halobaculum halobium TaxID=3032281 RepID=A0ABD5TAC8_9EURY|nr:hypothetical protein [Halobaculum sp. SYNS20]